MGVDNVWQVGSRILGWVGFVILFAGNVAILIGDDTIAKRGRLVSMASIPIILLAILWYLWGTL